MIEAERNEEGWVFHPRDLHLAYGEMLWISRNRGYRVHALDHPVATIGGAPENVGRIPDRPLVGALNVAIDARIGIDIEVEDEVCGYMVGNRGSEFGRGVHESVLLADPGQALMRIGIGFADCRFG